MVGVMKAVKVDLGSQSLMVFHPAQRIYRAKPDVKNCRAIVYWPLVPAYCFKLENQTLPSGRLFFFKRLSQTRDSLQSLDRILLPFVKLPEFGKRLAGLICSPWNDEPKK